MSELLKTLTRSGKYIAIYLSPRYECRPLLNDWAASLGQTFRVRGLFTHHRLYTLDPRAITHVMAHTNLYQKPQILRPILRRYMKEGMIVSEGERQKVQRRVVGRWFAKRGRGMEGVVWEETVKVSFERAFEL